MSDLFSKLPKKKGMTKKKFMAALARNSLLWAVYGKVKLVGGDFRIEGHKYQIEWFTNDTPRKVVMKAAQLGCTECEVLKNLHGLISGKYKTGVLYLLPTRDDATDFSKGRFQPLVEMNPELIGAFVRSTDAANIKRIGRGLLYIRGARVSQKIGGVKKTSSQLKSIPVDKITFDERDEMDPEMVDLARLRIAHSAVGEMTSLSTPSIPDWGIHLEYLRSDQRKWVIRCRKCNTETCLEDEFPNCLEYTSDGKSVVRVCRKCRQEIFPDDGMWVPSFPDRSKDLAGWHISQLNSSVVLPLEILKEYEDPPHGNIGEFYNSRLGLPYIDVENRLTLADVYALCGQDQMAYSHGGPCAMGIDVGKTYHIVVMSKLSEESFKIEYLAEVSDLNDAHDIAMRFNVACAVIDYKPEIHKALAFRQAEPYEVFVCDYVRGRQGGAEYDSKKGFVTVNRTEICDATQELVRTKGRLTLPRKNSIIETYAQHMTNTAKVLKEDQETGSKEFRYVKLGPDHFYHATNYAYLATQRIGISKGILQRFRPWLFKPRKKVSWMAR